MQHQDLALFAQEHDMARAGSKRATGSAAGSTGSAVAEGTAVVNPASKRARGASAGSAAGSRKRLKKADVAPKVKDLDKNRSGKVPVLIDLEEEHTRGSEAVSEMPEPSEDDDGVTGRADEDARHQRVHDDFADSRDGFS